MQQTLPPQELIDMVGGGDFLAIGTEFLGLYRTTGELRADAHILDLGCGAGRMALPLTEFVDGGTYDGFDVHRGAIDWCNATIAPGHPDFNFRYVDLHNTVYNREATDRAETFVFPYADEQFDFACASSLFTHLLPEETANYLQQARRVLRPGGRAMFTFFISTPESEELMSQGKAPLHFATALDGCRVANPADPHAAVLYPESAVRLLFAEAGLVISDIHFGSWPGRDSGLTFQDMVVAERPAAH